MEAALEILADPFSAEFNERLNQTSFETKRDSVPELRRSWHCFDIKIG